MVLILWVFYEYKVGNVIVLVQDGCDEEYGESNVFIMRLQVVAADVV